MNPPLQAKSGAIGRTIVLMPLFVALAAPGAQLMDRLRSEFQIQILPGSTNFHDTSADYLLSVRPAPIRYQPLTSVPHHKARRLLPKLIVDDPDTGRKTSYGQADEAGDSDSSKGPKESEPKKNPPAPKNNEPVTRYLKPVRKQHLVAPLIDLSEPTPDKVTVVESPPPAMQIWEEEKRRRNFNHRLRSLVPYFIGSRTNTSTNTGPTGLTNSLVPFAPPVFSQ